LTEEERQALSALRFDWATTPDDVWRTSPFHVEGLHSHIAQSVLNGINDAKASKDSSPIGIALQGQKGAGKTHLLGWVREKVQSEGGYFFLVSLLDGNAFWENTVRQAQDEARPRQYGTTLTV
jgi:chromosomal replication initiation ATPase DnaA